MKKRIFVWSYDDVKKGFEEHLKRNPPGLMQLKSEVLYPYFFGMIKSISNMEDTTPSGKVQSIKNCIKAFDDLTRFE